MKHLLVLGGLCSLLLDISAAAAAPTPAPTLVTAPPPSPCDAFGDGLFQIPQSDLCLRLSGDALYEVTAGSDVYTGARSKTWKHLAKGTLDIETLSDTEWGVLKTYIGVEGRFADGSDDGVTFSGATLELAGLLVGAADSRFETWLDSAGTVLSDDVVPYAGEMTAQINYTRPLGSGYTVLFGIEQGSNLKDKDRNSSADDAGTDDTGTGDTGTDDTGTGDSGTGRAATDHTVDGYLPHLLAGLRMERSWGTLGAIVAYDSVIHESAAKVRLDVPLGADLSGFVMGGYQTDAEKNSYYGVWDDTYAAWGGVSAVLTPRLTLNNQISYSGSGTYALAINVDYEFAPGFIVTPELDYTSFGTTTAEITARDAYAGVVSLQRKF